MILVVGEEGMEGEMVNGELMVGGGVEVEGEGGGVAWWRRCGCGGGGEDFKGG